MANEFNIKNGFISNGDGSVNGRLTTQNLTITSGATNGYVLTSDSNGNATWQVPTDTNFANTDLTFTGNRNHDTNGNDLYIYNGLGLDGFGPNINSISIGDPRVAIGYGYYLNNISLDIGVYNGNTGFTFTTQGVERMRMNNSGNLGIGTTSPSEKLDVSGKTKTTNFQMTSGATNGYVLTSDANGNATWQAPTGGGGVSINSYFNVGSASTITWNVSGQSTNYEVTLTAATTLNLTNVRNGEYGTIIVKQDTVGSRTISLGTVNSVSGVHMVSNGGGGSIVLTSNANATDILTFTYNGSIMYWTVGNDYT